MKIKFFSDFFSKNFFNIFDRKNFFVFFLVFLSINNVKSVYFQMNPDTQKCLEDEFYKGTVNIFFNKLQLQENKYFSLSL